MRLEIVFHKTQQPQTWVTIKMFNTRKTAITNEHIYRLEIIQCLPQNSYNQN